MNWHAKNIAALPKKKPKLGQIHVDITIKDLDARKTYYAQNGSPITLKYFSFSRELLKNIKNPHFREEFKKLLNILDRHGYEGVDHESKKGIVKIKETQPEFLAGSKEYKLKAAGIDLQIYGVMDEASQSIVFNEFHLNAPKPKAPDLKAHHRRMRIINRL